MKNKYRKLWRGAQGFGLAVVAIAVACSDLPDSGTDDGDAGAAGESGSAGTSGSGSAGKVGAGSAGEGHGQSAGSGSELAGAGGQSLGAGGQGGAGEAGQASAGEAGMSGAGGEGSISTRACVPETEYCDPEPCVQFSAGCVDHKCLPALALGTTCTSNRQCDSGRCDATSHQCVASVACGCQIAAPTGCPEGQVCMPAHIIDPCYYSGGTQCVTPGAYGAECTAGPCNFGLACYATPNGTRIQRCFFPKQEGEQCTLFDEAAQCGPGLDCIVGELYLNGICTAHGDACPCRVGYKCGDDNKCHALAKVGESCASTACDRSLRCPQ